MASESAMCSYARLSVYFKLIVHLKGVSEFEFQEAWIGSSR